MSEQLISLLEKVGVPAFIVLALMVGAWRAAHSVAPTIKGWVDLVLQRWLDSTKSRDQMDIRIIEHQYKLDVDAQRRHAEVMDRAVELAKETRHVTKNVAQQVHGLLGPEFDKVLTEIKNQGQKTRAAMTGNVEDTGDMKHGEDR